MLVVSPDGNGLIGEWSPGIGDPSVIGWLTTFAYFATAFGCWLVVKLTIKRGITQRIELSTWRALAAIFCLLGINKQLDLQSAFTVVGRMLAKDEGWYEQRRIVQLVFIVVIALLSGALVLGALYLARGASRHARTALIGFGAVSCFVVIRAASFHHIDQFLSFNLWRIRANWILELGGISLSGFAAHSRLRYLTSRR
jgi:hypothetical protein